MGTHLIHSAAERRALAGGFLAVGALICFCAILLLLAGPYEIERALRVGVAAVFGGALLLFLLHVPAIGFGLLLIGGLMVNRTLGTGTATDLNGAYLMVPVLTAVWLLQSYLDREAHARVGLRELAPIYAFMGAAVLATAVGQYPWFPTEPAPIRVQLAQLSIFLFLGLLFVLSAHLLQQRYWLQKITWLFVLLGAVHLAFRFVPALSDLSGMTLPPEVHSGSMFWTWLVAMCFAQALLNHRLHPLLRLGTGALVALAILTLLLEAADWLSGWFPALIAMGVIVIARWPRFVLLVGVPAAILAVLFGTMAFEFAATDDNLYSLETRWAAIQSLTPILAANPLLGVGPANYYAYTPLFPILGWYVPFSSHNFYLDLAAQLGLVGMVCFFWFASVIGLKAWKLRRRVTGGFETAYVFAILGGGAATLAAGALGDWIVPFVYNAGLEGFRTSVLPWLFLGGLLALEKGMKRER